MTRSSFPLVCGLALLAVAGCAGGTDPADVASAPATGAPARSAGMNDDDVEAAEPVATGTLSPSTAPLTTTPETTTPPTAAAPTTSPPTTAPEPVVRSGADASPDQPVGEPLSILIPEIGVRSSLVAAGVLDDGTVDVPEDPSIAGWFTGGPRPGERGPAVIFGHVDSRAYGPGVFYRLAELPVGAVVVVETTTGPQQFVVRSVDQYPKDQFPTDLVYGAEPASTLRLITCGGSFDSSVRSYRDNIIAFLVRTAG